MGEEHNGRVRGVGLGPTPTSYYGRKRARNESSDFVQSKKIEFLEKQLEEVTKNYDTVTTTLNGLKAWISKTFPGALEVFIIFCNFIFGYIIFRLFNCRCLDFWVLKYKI